MGEVDEGANTNKPSGSSEACACVAKQDFDKEGEKMWSSSFIKYDCIVNTFVQRSVHL